MFHQDLKFNESIIYVRIIIEGSPYNLHRLE